MKSGYGVESCSNGVKYKGEFQENCKNGAGHYINPGRFEYKGTFSKNEMTGRGTFIDAEENEYVGDLVKG